MAAAALIAGVLGLIVYETGGLNALERNTVDARFGIRGDQSPPDDVVIIARDQKTLTARNLPPPIPRRYYAHLLRVLSAAQAQPRLIGFDVNFLAPADDPRDDRALREAFAESPSPVLVITHDSGDDPIPEPTGRQHVEGVSLGDSSLDTDPDGILRRMIYAPVRLKTFAVRAAELLGAPVTESDFPDNHAWFDFRGPPGTFPTYSLIDVLDGTVPPSTFSSKIVLVGVTDPVEKDVVDVTPVSSTPMPGVEIQANGLTTILDGFPLRPVSGAVNVLLIIALAALPAILCGRLATPYMLLAALAILLVFLVGAQLAFDSGRIVSVMSPVLALTFATVGCAGVDVLFERRERQMAEAALARLPSDAASEFFISYRRDEARWPARFLKDELTKRFGESSVFMDLDSIGAGRDWPNSIQEALLRCNVALVLIGRTWLTATGGDGARRIDDPADWVRLEVETALKEAHIAVVPVLLDGATMPTEEQLPDPIKPLAHRNAATLTDEHWSSDIAGLVKSIQDGRIRDFLSREARERGAT